jgi:glycerol-3-phosphate dehydrogenase
MTDATKVDLVVIGGGINGVGVARDAAGRGLKVLLCEKDDLAMHTSSASTKLIHGGLRYLEHYDFMLVRHALQEREVLLRSAPHIIWPLRFILPHHRDLRPRWMIRLGLFLYDHIGGRKILPASHSVDLRTHVSGECLKDTYTNGFEYSDCWVQDSRLVVLNARDAADHGADIRVRTECTDLTATDDGWQVELLDKATDKKTTVAARAVINASGPWVEETLDLQQRNKSKHGVRLVKGSHVVVPKLFDHDYTYTFQNADGRVLFAVPYEHHYTLLGTTDIEVEGDPGQVEIEQREIDYICEAVGEYFNQPIDPATVVWSYAGVRPLYDDASENASHVTRDYVIHMTKSGPPMVSIFGGKITTYRKLSEEVVDMVLPALQQSAAAWTSGTHLPGGDIADADFVTFHNALKQRLSWMPEAVLADYARNYGTRIDDVLNGATSVADLGEDFGGGLYEAEVRYLIRVEWARTAEDILWRRSRKGLHVGVEGRDRLQQWMQSNGQALAAA